MSDLVKASEHYRYSSIQQKIIIARWLIVLLLSLRGLYTLYGWKEKGFLELTVTALTEPIVLLFSLSMSKNETVPGLSILFATVSLLIASYIAQFIIKHGEARYLKSREFNGAAFPQRQFRTYP